MAPLDSATTTSLWRHGALSGMFNNATTFLAYYMDAELSASLTGQLEVDIGKLTDEAKLLLQQQQGHGSVLCRR